MKNVLGLSLLLALVACGGGGYDNTPEPPPDLSSTFLQGVLEGDKPVLVQLSIAADGSTVSGYAFVENTTYNLNGSYSNASLNDIKYTSDGRQLLFSAPLKVEGSTYSFSGNWTGLLPAHAWIKTTQQGNPYSGSFTLKPATGDDLKANVSALKAPLDAVVSCAGVPAATVTVHSGTCYSDEVDLAWATLCPDEQVNRKIRANKFYTCARDNSTGLWQSFYDQALVASQK